MSDERRPACEGADPNIFFPEGRAAKVVEAMALSYCQTCPVVAECLDLAMKSERGVNRSGIYGAKTPEERSLLGRRRARRA